MDNNTINSDLIRGHIDTIILKALQDGDRYGYDIIKEIEHKSGGQYIIKQPTLYSCLKRLEVQGFVKSYWGSKSIGGRKKYFTLTDMGRQVFLKNQTEWEFSRTVIDKLISDGENFENIAASMTNGDESSSELENDFVQDAEPEENTDFDNIYEENTDSDNLYNAVETFDSYHQNNDDSYHQNNDMDNVVDDDETVSQDLDNKLKDILWVNTEKEDSYISGLRNDEYSPTDFSAQTAASFSANDYFTDYETPEETDEIKTLPEVTASEKNDNKTTSSSSVIEREQPVFQSYDDRKPRSFTNFFSYRNRNLNVDPDSDDLIIEKEYKSVLEKMIEENVKKDVEPSMEVQENIKKQFSDRVAETEGFNDIVDAVKENLGDEITLRSYNENVVKTYKNKHYYFVNKLKLVQNGILFLLMLLEIVICFYLIEVSVHGLDVKQSDLTIYIAAVVLSAIFPIFAFINAASDFFKRKKIDYSAKATIGLSFAIMFLLMLIIFFLNVYAGLLTGEITDYLSSLILPMVLSTNVPIYAICFHFLYRSNKFNLE